MVDINLTTLSGYNTLTPNAAYNIQVKAKAAGYEDSDLSNAIRYVASRPVTYPVKGDCIALDHKKYRVLKINGSIAEVLTMDEVGYSKSFGTSRVYANSALDTYCNDTFYNSLSTSMQNAIVAKTFTQDSWFFGDVSYTDGNPKYVGNNAINGAYEVSLSSASFGASISRKCYALSIQDIIDYLDVTPSMSSTTTTLTDTNIWKMFWDQTTSPGSGDFWLRSIDDSDDTTGYSINANIGTIYWSPIDDTIGIRLGFQIDLAKIDWLRILDAGTYQWVVNPNMETAPTLDAFSIYWSGATLTANNVYGNKTYYTALNLAGRAGRESLGVLDMSNSNNESINYDGSTWLYLGGDQFTATDTSKLRTIEIPPNRSISSSVPPKFYDWAITEGNLVKQS